MARKKTIELDGEKNFKGTTKMVQLVVYSSVTVAVVTPL